MSMTGQRATRLVAAYNTFLENQIEAQGSSLPCREEKLCTEVEDLLKSEDGHDTHCLGLDTYKIMEKSLQLAAIHSKGTTNVRAGLKGLAKAFEVLEQAALNLYLGSWREEYKVVKMYSGIFTHYIKPVFSMQQIEELFSLLGYELCSKRREQLRLQPQKVSGANLNELLCLSCAFFVARCECRLLLAALGKHGGQPQWELSLVGERLRGHSLQVALDNTTRTVEVKKPLPEVPEETDMDLYTDEQDNRSIGKAVDDETPRSLTWMPEKSAAYNKMTPKQQVYISTHYRQVNNTAADSKANGFSPRDRYRNHLYESVDEIETHYGHLNEDKTSHFIDDAESIPPCSCLQTNHSTLYNCTECLTYHYSTCPLLEPCKRQHMLKLEYVDKLPEQFAHIETAALQHRRSTSPTSSSAEFASLALYDNPKFNSPMAYHICCDVSKPAPRILCYSCKQFHSWPCDKISACIDRHKTKKLGVCSENICSERKIAVLCRYCGKEYCKECWYKHPYECTCGQTFDPSSSV